MRRHLALFGYRVLIILLSAIAAMSLPSLITAAAGNLSALTAVIEQDKLLLAGLEIVTAFACVLLLQGVRTLWRDRQLSRIAGSAGLALAVLPSGKGSPRSRKKARSLKQGRGCKGEIMIIGSTGRSFHDPDGDLYEAVHHCREAKIMLLDPREHGAIKRGAGDRDPEITAEAMRQQIATSIEFIKQMRGYGKKIRLKLYPDMPLFKLAVLGDHAHVRHYHTGLNVRAMPEFVFADKEGHGGMYLPLYRYFRSRWQHPDIPEYDLDSDELVYHDQLGYEVLRERFDGKTFMLPDEERAGEVSGPPSFLENIWIAGAGAAGKVIPSER